MSLITRRTSENLEDHEVANLGCKWLDRRDGVQVVEKPWGSAPKKLR